MRQVTVVGGCTLLPECCLESTCCVAIRSVYGSAALRDGQHSAGSHIVFGLRMPASAPLCLCLLPWEALFKLLLGVPAVAVLLQLGWGHVAHEGLRAGARQRGAEQWALPNPVEQRRSKVGRPTCRQIWHTMDRALALSASWLLPPAGQSTMRGQGRQVSLLRVQAGWAVETGSVDAHRTCQLLVLLRLALPRRRRLLGIACSVAAETWAQEGRQC